MTVTLDAVREAWQTGGMQTSPDPDVTPRRSSRLYPVELKVKVSAEMARRLNAQADELEWSASQCVRTALHRWLGARESQAQKTAAQ